MKVQTLSILREGNQLLMGKKVPGGFGGGVWNFFGGKRKSGENIPACAVRETREECGAVMVQFEKKGIVIFDFQDSTESKEVHIFECTSWMGKIKRKTQEMDTIQFFDEKHLPFEMWPGDIFWLPTFLSGKKFRGRFTYNHHPSKDGLKVLEHNIEIVETLETAF